MKVANGLQVVAVASVFLAAKDRSFPFRLSEAARLLYELEMKMQNMPSSLTTGFMKGGGMLPIVGGT
jgi:mannose/fructose/N-acetylgalactosamine-specific phosphotransferase system component IIC